MNKIIKLGTLFSLILTAQTAFASAPAPVIESAPGSGYGVAWPSPRFVAGSGTSANCVIDKLTGLMWPKNGIIGFLATAGGDPIAQPNYTSTDPTLNKLSWSQSITAVANMNSAPIKLCGYSDWRLPNVVELRSMLNYGAAIPANWLMYGTGSSGSPACSGACFANLQPSAYWSSSVAGNTQQTMDLPGAWAVFFDGGRDNIKMKQRDSGDMYTPLSAWPVRGGK